MKSSQARLGFAQPKPQGPREQSSREAAAQ